MGGVKENFKVLSVAGLASMCSVIELKLLQSLKIIYVSSRTGTINSETLLQNFRQLYQIIIKTILPTANRTYPDYILPIFILMIFTVLIFLMLKKHVSFQKYIYVPAFYLTRMDIIKELANAYPSELSGGENRRAAIASINAPITIQVFFISRLSVYAPHIVATSIWPAQRSLLSFWSILSFPLLFIEYWRGINLKKTLGFFIALILCVNIACIVKMEVALLSTNKIEQEISYLIQSRINKYENETGNKIKTIIFRNDDRPTWSYKSPGYSAYNFAIRTYAPSWGAGISLINYFNNRSYNRRQMTPEEFNELFVKKFNKRNWDILDLNEQLIFSGEECYMISY